jgi:hypothetical protein
MPFDGDRFTPDAWRIRKIGVVGPGIVGMPMAALLAHARIREGSFRAGPGGRRPAQLADLGLEGGRHQRRPLAHRRRRAGPRRIVRRHRREGRPARREPRLRRGRRRRRRGADLRADRQAGSCPTTARCSRRWSCWPRALRTGRRATCRSSIFESTLAPSSMTTMVRAHFARHGLEEGRDVLLGNSPNRVMPGRLVERVAAFRQAHGGLHRGDARADRARVSPHRDAAAPCTRPTA